MVWCFKNSFFRWNFEEKIFIVHCKLCENKLLLHVQYKLLIIVKQDLSIMQLQLIVLCCNHNSSYYWLASRLTSLSRSSGFVIFVGATITIIPVLILFYKQKRNQYISVKRKWLNSYLLYKPGKQHITVRVDETKPNECFSDVYRTKFYLILFTI